MDDFSRAWIDYEDNLDAESMNDLEERMEARVVNRVGSAAPTVTGSRGGNVALANLLTALDNLGLIQNSTS